jgi:hypothetical protein
MKFSGLLFITALALVGCAEHVGFHSSHIGFTREPQYAQPSAIPCYGTKPLRYTIYTGSDAKWHYFETHHDLRLERYKVPRWSMVWRHEFPAGKGRLYVEHDREGHLQAIPPSGKRG